MSPENQADHEVAPAARFVETRPFRASPDGRDGLFDLGCCFTRGPSPPSTGNSKLPKNGSTVPRASPFASNVYRSHHSFTYAASTA